MHELRRFDDTVLQEHDKRLIIVEKDILILQKDVREHKLSMDQVVSVLTQIREEIVATKSFLKAICLGAVVLCTLTSAVWTVGWIKIPNGIVSSVSR